MEKLRCSPETLRSAWLRFIFRGGLPTSVKKVGFLCGKDKRFSNLCQHAVVTDALYEEAGVNLNCDRSLMNAK